MEREGRPEQPVFFDERASTRMMALDIARYGAVRPETRQQVENEELSFVAEGIDAPMETRFTLRMTEDGLVNESGDLLRVALQRGLRAAEIKAQTEPSYNCLARRAVHEKHEGDLVEAMMRGQHACNTIVSVSPFAEETHRQYGDEKLEDMGFQPRRKLAFIRVYRKLPDNQLEVVSLSIDNSHLGAFRELLASGGVEVAGEATSDDYLAYNLQLDLSRDEQTQLPTQLLRRYDQALYRLTGTQTRAGRPLDQEVEGWSFLKAQTDLVQHYMMRLEKLAHTSPDDMYAKKKLTRSFWAALSQRFKQVDARTPLEHLSRLSQHQALEQEMTRAFNWANANHLRLIGCGGAIDAFGQKDDLMKMSPEEARSAIFNDKPESYKFDRYMFCNVCQAPPKEDSPKKKMCGPCGICRTCDAMLKVKTK